ncbi:MAG: hypothetical protein H6993_09000 [Pseudomonadales bacterium]|nr:hypothetical protein [Pseudomonadales bacterium]
MEVRKWQQRVPRIAEMLRRRSEALDWSQKENRALRRELEQMRTAPAPDREFLLPEVDGVNHAQICSQLERQVQSLQARNQSLSRTLEVLTEQFAHANEEIRLLRDELARSEALVEGARSRGSEIEMPRAPQHPLRCIRGIGAKSLETLRAAGIETVEALAQLEPALLDDPESLLYPHRTRIRRERWIEQAAARILQ